MMRDVNEVAVEREDSSSIISMGLLDGVDDGSSPSSLIAG